MGFRHQSSPPSPSTSRRLFAGSSWLSTLTSALFKRSKSNRPSGPPRTPIPSYESPSDSEMSEISSGHQEDSDQQERGRRDGPVSVVSDGQLAPSPLVSASNHLRSISESTRPSSLDSSLSLSFGSVGELPDDWDESEIGESSRKNADEGGLEPVPGPISKIPDHVLLEIFDLYRVSSKSSIGRTAHTWPWERLVHVCQTWRYLVFGSPRRLDLHLVCDPRTPVRKTLDIWPALPIIIQSTLIRPTLTFIAFKFREYEHGENISAALEHRDRVCKIELKKLTSPLSTRFIAVMQEPFPALTDLSLSSDGDAAPVLPGEFLGRSSPNLQYFDLDGIPFPALPKLLLSATHLVRLRLWRIPHNGYVSPEAMATCLAALPKLESIVLEFQSPRSRLSRDNRRPSSPTRAVLPALTSFDFQGVSEYLEDLVAQIDAPLLNRAKFRFFNQLTFDNPQLSRFIDRTDMHVLLSRAEVQFFSDVVKVTLSSTVGGGKLELEIVCYQPDWQVSSMARLCSQLSGVTSRVEQLEVRKGCIPRSKWPEDMECSQWLELFDPFVAVEMLSIPRLVVPALLELTGVRATDVLPMMRCLSFRGLKATSPIKDDLEPFVSARQSSNHPVSVLWGTSL